MNSIKNKGVSLKNIFEIAKKLPQKIEDQKRLWTVFDNILI